MLFGVDGLVILYMTWLMNSGRRSLEETNRDLQSQTRTARERWRVRETIELAPDAYFLANLDARFTDVNQAACRLLGYERDELIGKTIFDVIPPEDVARLEAVKAELLAPTRCTRPNGRLKRKDGTLVPVEVSANILPDGRWQAFIRDISERRRIEDERQVFVSLLDNSSDFIGIADPAGKPIYLNAAGRRMIGLAPDFPIDQIAIEDCYPPELLSFVKDVILATMRERGQWKGETFFQNVSTHAKIPVSDTHFMIRDASGERILGMGTVTRDISDARRVAEEREQLLAREQLARRDAERAVVARDSILGIVAHDLRNPLSAILMQAELLERDNPEFERRDQTPRLVLTRSAERMNSSDSRSSRRRGHGERETAGRAAAPVGGRPRARGGGVAGGAGVVIRAATSARGPPRRSRRVGRS